MKNRARLAAVLAGLLTCAWASTAAWAERPLFEEEPSTQPATSREAALKLGAEVIQRVNDGCYHWLNEESFDAQYVVEKDGAGVGSLRIAQYGSSKWEVGPVKGAIDTGAAGAEPYVRTALAESLIAAGFLRVTWPGSREPNGPAIKVGGVTHSYPSGFLLAEDGDSADRGFYVVSDDYQVCEHAVEFKKDKENSGQTCTLKTRKVGGKNFVESLDVRHWEFAAGEIRDEKLAVEFTYAKKDGLPYVKRFEIVSRATANGRARIEKYRVTADPATVKSACRGMGQLDLLAQAAVRAWRDKDFIDLVRLSSGESRKLFNELADRGDTHSRYKSLFGQGWRADAVNAWDGSVGKAKYPSDKQAWVAFGKDAGAAKIPVVRLAGAGKEWYFDDLIQVDKKEFDEAPGKREGD